VGETTNHGEVKWKANGKRIVTLLKNRISFLAKQCLQKNNKLPKSSKKSRSFEYENDDE